MRSSVWLLGFLFVGTLLIGCAGDPPGKDRSASPKVPDAKPAQPSDLGPGGGPLIDLGGGYFAEFTVDHKQKLARVAFLAKDARTPAPIKSNIVILNVDRPRFELELKPERQKGDPDGAASVFVGTHEHLGRERDLDGKLSVDIDGKQHEAAFTGHGHPPK